MEIDYEEKAPIATLKSVIFNITSSSDAEKLSSITIGANSEVNDPRLGLPNPTHQCSTCSAKDVKSCEGHNGVIMFPCCVLHPYYLSEVVKLLNKVCANCKSERKPRAKTAKMTSEKESSVGCKYCRGNNIFWYPSMKFSFSAKDYQKSCVVVEVIDRVPANIQKKQHKGQLPSDYWDFLGNDPELELLQQDSSSNKPNRRILSHSQVYHLVKDIEPKILERFGLNMDTLFLDCFPVTPNSHRVTEVMHSFSHGQRLMFDNRTRAYKKLVDFRGTPNQLGSRVQECLKISKLNPDKLSGMESAFSQQKKQDMNFISSGLRWMKDVILGKRSDRCFRMVVVGNPNLKPNEVGIPRHIAERVQISESLNRWNWEKLKADLTLSLIDKGDVFVRRQGKLVPFHQIKEFFAGDTISRPLTDGDIVLINRPPTIHQHSLISLLVKVLPGSSVLSINPLCCSPLRGDFDGDCLHGYIPQSLEARVELKELVGLDRQLVNEQSGRNLLSLGQDSLTAAHLVLSDDAVLDRVRMQQLCMWCPNYDNGPRSAWDKEMGSDAAWTGKQLFSMLLPRGLHWEHPRNDVCILDGEITSLEGSNWLRDADENLIQCLVREFPGRVLEFLKSAQEMLCEWLMWRGFSVSLLDLYLSTDTESRRNMLDEVSFGLEEAEEMCNFKQLMVEASRDFLKTDEDEEHCMEFEPTRLNFQKQKSAALSQGSVDTFRRAFRDISTLAYKYASKDNSMMTMFKSGSKGNLMKIVQHSMSVGLQNSLVPLPFKFPHRLSCSSWNGQVKADSREMLRDSQFPRSFIPYAVVENSFLTGLNPAECFVHSVTNRSSSFSENAEVPGTLHRRLMFFLRDLYVSYDGTVRNAHGNQLVEFEYKVRKPEEDRKAIGGHPVGSLCACAISEAAYSALDQPISLLETSPLLNLKSVLECGSKKSNANQTMSLFLSKKLGKVRHGFEYGSLAVKNHLERLFLSDIVSSAMIFYFPEHYERKGLSPWVCHFHISKEILKRKGLEVNSIISSLEKKWKSGKTGLVICMEAMTNNCAVSRKYKEDRDTFCITISIQEEGKIVQLKTVQDIVIPFLMETVVKGFSEIKKVDILWFEKSYGNPSGELFLKVSMSGSSEKLNLWSALVYHCVGISDMIDWTQSRPDNIREFASSYGIDSGFRHFLNSLQSAISDTGKTILAEHMLLIGNVLSNSGEFVSLNAKGMARQRESASVSSPFVQACFSSPGTSFIKAAKAGLVDKLEGSLDALAWGRVPVMGTGEIFELIYSRKEHEIEKPEDVYSLLSHTNSIKSGVKWTIPTDEGSDRFGDIRLTFSTDKWKGLKGLQNISKKLQSFFSYDDIYRISEKLRSILKKYKIDEPVDEYDKKFLRMVLKFHPNGDRKLGSGAREIKVGYHPKHKESRCFILERTDGTTEDFSYHKCILGALQIIAPKKVDRYRTKWLSHDDKAK